MWWLKPSKTIFDSALNHYQCIYWIKKTWSPIQSPLNILNSQNWPTRCIHIYIYTYIHIYFFFLNWHATWSLYDAFHSYQRVELVIFSKCFTCPSCRLSQFIRCCWSIKQIASWPKFANSSVRYTYLQTLDFSDNLIKDHMGRLRKFGSARWSPSNAVTNVKIPSTVGEDSWQCGCCLNPC